MARAKSLADRLHRIIVEGLDVAGIKSRAKVERVRGTKLHRVYIIANGFAKLNGDERQNLTWRIIRQSLTPDERLRICMVYTVTARELPSGIGIKSTA